ncbi:MAG TPA: TPM domain-containing protein [Xanthomonadaceae bacterium]|nr:TPM domain-containing protein [Xanthomonadaceae bacterium]
MARLPRLWRHLFAPTARRLFPEAALAQITEAIAQGEARHRGEVCFAVESALPWRAVVAGTQPRARAQEVFAQLRVWDTAANNGVLVYLLLADHRIEIVADRGLDGRVSAEQWDGVCLLMEERLRAGDAQDAALQGVLAVTDLIAQHFPPAADDSDDRNELPDRPHLLD